MVFRKPVVQNVELILTFESLLTAFLVSRYDAKHDRNMIDRFGLVYLFNGISTFVGYLMLKPFL